MGCCQSNRVGDDQSEPIRSIDNKQIKNTNASKSSYVNRQQVPIDTDELNEIEAWKKTIESLMGNSKLISYVL